MKTEKERLLAALAHINDVQTLTIDNKWKKYLHQHLVVVEYELQRQLSLINENDRRGLQIGNPEFTHAAKQQPEKL
tara:strand:+ start:104 stop:331 length:228 start_codon:yes stop_codon:yes gene_type:complete